MYESFPPELPSPVTAYHEAVETVSLGNHPSDRSVPDYRAALQVMTAFYERAYRQVHQLLRDLGKVSPPSMRAAAGRSGACLGDCCESRNLIGCRPPATDAPPGEAAR